MTQKLVLVVAFLLLTAATHSQETLKKALGEISNELCVKLANKNIKRVVVLFVTDISKNETTAGKYIADIVSYHIVNDANNFSVFDRENLSGIAEAKRLIAEGYIDADNAKQLGKLLSVDAIIIGNYTVLSSISLTLKALDVNDGFIIAQSLKDLPKDRDAAALLGVNFDTGADNSLNRGFNNRPLNSNENYNNPETVNKECETKNTGDYCFQNLTNKRLKVFISHVGECIVEPAQTQCFYNVKAASYSYEIEVLENKVTYRPVYEKAYAKGNILIERCKSKTFIIK